MTRLKNTFITGICMLSICLTGAANLSLAKDKKSPDLLTTCICDQVPLYPVGGTLWAWMAYKYEYETDCTAATAVSIINYNDYEAYPETLCKDTGSCGSECSTTKEPPDKRATITTEPGPDHYLHPLPAPPTAKFDLYPPQIELEYKILETRFLKFEKASRRTRYAKVFFVHLSASENPSGNGKSLYFWYGFEVAAVPPTADPMSVPYSNVNRRAIFYKKDPHGITGIGRCGEFALVNYGGSEFLIRFQRATEPSDGCSDCDNSKDKAKKKKKN